ncbi:MAG: hypothetical protein IT158_07470 [Bryobacterales bacterium]|nr:hypothetical protein [Bryobacterales bacterium]
MRRLRGPVLFALMALLFLIANRGAYESYFQDDEIDNVYVTGLVEASTFASTLLSPRFQPNNFRPAGHLFYKLMGEAFGLDFPKYAAAIHLVHFLNVWLVWLIARRMGFGWYAASAGALVFAFHMAVFDAYWKPMYVFDLLCAFFCLAALLMYMKGRRLLSLPLFWLAYKSKEIAVMLPAVLLVYEVWLGEKRWKRTLPFFAIAALFGLQGVFMNPNVDNEYTLRFTPAAVWQCLRFYSSEVLFLPYAGLALPLAAWLARDRRTGFGLALMGLFFLPLLFLPGRLFAAYCYLPLAGLAPLAARLAELRPAAAAALLAVVWIPWNMTELKGKRRQALAIAAENREYVRTVEQFARSGLNIESAVYDGAPSAFHRWGVESTLRYFYARPEMTVCAVEDPCAAEVWKGRAIAMLAWDPEGRRLLMQRREPGAPDASHIRMSRAAPLWQFLSGWHRLEGNFRWMGPEAAVRLERPAGARAFEVVVNAGPAQIRDLGNLRVEVRLNGESLGEKEVSAAGWKSLRWNLENGPAGPVTVQLRTRPVYRPRGDPRALGAAVVSLGFPSE